MSIFSRGERRSDPPGAVLPAPGGSRPVSLRVTPDTAMRHSAVAACVLKISNLGTLEPHSYRERDGLKVKAAVDPQILRAPSAESTPLRWRREVFDAWLRRGTAFGIVTQTDQLAYPSRIELVDADCVTVRPRNGYKPTAAATEWVWYLNGAEVQRWPHGPLWVAPGLYTRPGLPVGISPIEMALGAIRLGLAAEEYGASWFYEGGQPTGVLQSDQVLSPDTADKAKKRFTEALRSGGVAVLGAGLRYDRVQVAANESQFLETLDRNVATVCRFFLMPPEEVGSSSGSSMTYANIEARGLSLMVSTYGPWLSHLEATLDTLTPGTQDVQVDTDQLLRLDAKTRTDLDVADLRAGIRSREEVRRTRSLGAVAEEDHIVWPPFSTSLPKADPPPPPPPPPPSSPPAPPAEEEPAGEDPPAEPDDEGEDQDGPPQPA